MSKKSVKDEKNSSVLIASTLVAELNIDPEKLKERWPNLEPDTEIDKQLEEQIRFWAEDSQASPEQQQIRTALKLRLLDGARKTAVLSEVERLIESAHASNGADLPSDPIDAALVEEVRISEKKLQDRMGGHLYELTKEIYIDGEGNVVIPQISFPQLSMRQSASLGLLETSETLPALASADD